MGIIDIHIHDGVTFTFDVGGDTEDDDVGIAPADAEAAGNGPASDESAACSACGCKQKAVGLLALLGVFAAAGLLAKRALGGDGADIEA